MDAVTTDESRESRLRDASIRLGGLVEALDAKMAKSQTPVPGFVLGLSGTDSIIAFEVLARVCERRGMGHRMLGVHYVDEGRSRPTWFASQVVPWLTARHPQATFLTTTPLGGNQDPQRWADLNLRSTHEVAKGDDGTVSLRPLPAEEGYWLAGSINATEHDLGRHTMMAKCVSIQPIRRLWKTGVLDMCEAIGVPSVAIQNARIPDCLCGRDEIAAENIELIDKILRNDFDPFDHDLVLLGRMVQWVAREKRENGFRQRTPYVP